MGDWEWFDPEHCLGITGPHGQPLDFEILSATRLAPAAAEGLFSCTVSVFDRDRQLFSVEGSAECCSREQIERMVRDVAAQRAQTGNWSPGERYPVMLEPIAGGPSLTL